ncbi:MAG: LapA family protein [Hyphomicrobiales bacterium]
MIRKIVTALILIPLAVLIVTFAVANRQIITVSFDPFDSAQPAYAAALPLFVVIFAALILGVLIGGVAAWLRQGKWRRAVRKLEAETRELHGELDDIRRRFGTPEQAALPPRAEPPPPLVMPPPVA